MWNWINNKLDRLEARISLYLFAFGNVTVTGLGAYIASVTDWMNAWGPVGWLFVGLTCALTLSLCLLFCGWFLEARSRRIINQRRVEQSTRINILDDSFEGEVIHVQDLWSFQHQILSGKRFHKCRFVGPMVIAFIEDVTANGLHARDCNFIEIGNSYLNGVVGFKGCTLTECEYDCVTFLIQEGLARKLANNSNGSLNFVSRPIAEVEHAEPKRRPEGQD